MVGTAYKMEIPHSDYIASNAPLTPEDLEYCNAHNEAIMNLWFGKLAALPSGFDKSNIVNYVPGIDASSGNLLQDLAFPIVEVEKTTDPHTSATSGSGTVTWGSEISTRQGWGAFSGVLTGDGVGDAWWASYDYYDLAWDEYTFTNPVELSSMRFMHNTSSVNFRVIDWRFHRWAGSQWVDIIVKTGEVFASGEWTTLNPIDLGYKVDKVRFKIDLSGELGGVFKVQEIEINYKEYEATAYEIQNYTEAARLANQTYGLQALSVVQDESGRPLAMADANTIVVDSSGKNLNGNWKPDLARFSIESTVGGNLADLDANGDPLGTFSQRVEARVQTHSVIDGDVYYINSIAQGYVPELPDPSKNILLNEIAPISGAINIQSATSLPAGVTES